MSHCVLSILWFHLKNNSCSYRQFFLFPSIKTRQPFDRIWLCQFDLYQIVEKSDPAILNLGHPWIYGQLFWLNFILIFVSVFRLIFNIVKSQIMGDPVHVTSTNDQCIKWTDIKPKLNKNITGFICRLVPEDAVWLINLIFKKRWWRVVMTIILISASYTRNH